MKQGPKETEWRERLADFAASGMTQKRWCAEQGVPVHQFHYWRKRLTACEEAKADTSGSTIEWCEVRRTPEMAASRLTIRVGGAGIEVRPGFDAGLLRAVVRTLREADTAGC